MVSTVKLILHSSHEYTVLNMDHLYKYIYFMFKTLPSFLLKCR